MSGATKQSNYFWICHRSKRTQTDDLEIITWDDIMDNFYQHANEVASTEERLVTYPPSKPDSIKKRLFRRFFPWKQAQK